LPQEEVKIADLSLSRLSAAQDAYMLKAGVSRMAHFFGTDLPSSMEPILLGFAWVAFMRAEDRSRFRAFGAYLSCRLAIVSLSLVLWQAARSGWIGESAALATYSDVSGTGSLLCAVMVFFVVRSIAGRIFEPLPGLERIGRMGFRWATGAAVFFGVVSAFFPAGASQDWLGGVLRGVGVFEFCLLAFLSIAMQTLRLSPKKREFGIALGLATIASARLAAAAFALRHSTMAPAASYAAQIAVALAAVVWAVYFARPAKEENVARPAEPSTLDRWQEVARALAAPAPQVALGKPSGSFFLDEVVKVVDKVMERNVANPGK